MFYDASVKISIVHICVILLCYFVYHVSSFYAIRIILLLVRYFFNNISSVKSDC